MEAHAWGAYLGAFFRIAGPLHQRLIAMGGSTNRAVASALHNPEAARDTLQWAHIVCEAHAAGTSLLLSFSPAEKETADRIAPRGNIIFSAGDPTSVVEDLPTTIEDEPLPQLHQATTAPRGIRFIAAKLRKLTEWRHFFQVHQRTAARDQPKLLAHARHGSVTVLHSDTPLGQRASVEVARTTIKRITGAVSLGRRKSKALHHCPQCGIQAGQVESLERHVVRCPNGGMRHLLHSSHCSLLAETGTGSSTVRDLPH